jgi:ribulose-phosphate 3-epimerase
MKKIFFKKEIMVKIYPSLMAANLVNLEKDIKILEKYCYGFHLDIMDFHFVNNLTFGPDTVNAIRKCAENVLWVHLMVESPEKYLPLLSLQKDDIISFHYEALSEKEIFDFLKKIRAVNLKAGLALNPKTPIEVIKPFFNNFDQVVLMSVEPGFSGQKFLSESIKRLKELYYLRDEHELNFSIAMDGGINLKNYKDLINNGVDEIALGGAIFNTRDPASSLKTFLE